MKSTGITKNVDASYRISIPAEIREQLDIKKGDTFEYFTDRKGRIIIKKVAQG